MYTNEIGIILDKLSFNEVRFLLEDNYTVLFEYIISRRIKLEPDVKKSLHHTSTFILNVGHILELSRNNNYYGLLQDINSYNIFSELLRQKLTEEEIKLVISHFSNTNISVIYSYTTETPKEFIISIDDTNGAIASFNNLLPGILTSLNITTHVSTLLISTNKKTKYKPNYDVLDKWITTNSPEKIKIILNSNSNLEQSAIIFDKYDNISVEIVDINSFYKFVLWLCKRNSTKIQTLVPFMDRLL